MEIRDIFAANLRRLRLEKGLSQEEFADYANVDRSYVSKLETRKAEAGLDMLPRLAKNLGRGISRPFDTATEAS